MSVNSDSVNSSISDDSLDQAIDRCHNLFTKLFKQYLKSFEIFRFITTKFKDFLHYPYFDGIPDECYYLVDKSNKEFSRAIQFIRQKSVLLNQESLLYKKAIFIQDQIASNTMKTVEYFLENFSHLFYLLGIDTQRSKFCNPELLTQCKSVHLIMKRVLSFNDTIDMLKAGRNNDEYTDNLRSFNRFTYDNALKFQEIVDDLYISTGSFNPVDSENL